MSKTGIKSCRAEFAWMRAGWGLGRWIGCLAICLTLSLMAGQARAQIVEYVHTDALGSPIAATNANGAVVERQIYEPYGAGVTRAPNDGPGFAGHIGDSATGLVYMEQRYYDSELGSFLSVDAVEAATDPVASFGRYRYASANPYRFVDPDGRAAVGREKVTGSRISGSPVAKAALAKSARGSATSQVLRTENSRVAKGPGGTQTLTREWSLDRPSANGGYVVQSMQLSGQYVQDGKEASFTTKYQEAWKVGPGESGTFPVADNFAVNTNGSESGSVTWQGSARFYEGLTLPPSFTPGGAREAGSLYSTYEDVRLDSQNATEPVDVKFSTSW